MEIELTNNYYQGVLLKKQEQNTSHRRYGGLKNNLEIHNAGETAHFIKVLTCAYSVPESRFYKSTKLLESMEIATQYLLNVQHNDGTIDLYSTNFHSPPDTAFVLEPLCAALSVLNQYDSPSLSKLKTDLKTFILKAADALTVGGIHTPNHRWVVCMALARVHSLFPNSKHIARIDDWLGEKIDIDPDGQFTEKSTAIYSPLTDRCLITIARLLNRPELLDPVRRNLEMTIYYIHPDGEVVTTASTRQDRYRRGSMAPYYYPYRYMALNDNNKKFAAMAKLIQQTAQHKLSNNLIYFLEDPSLKNRLPESEPLPVKYTKIFHHSKLARIRRNEISATIIAENPKFFSFHKGTAALEAIRFASAFFGKGQFQAEALLIDGDRFVLRQKLTGPYYQPLPIDARRPDGNWNKMDKYLRRQSEVQHLESIAIISESNGKFEISLDIHGTDNVPVSIEFCFRHGGRLKGVRKISDVKDAYILEEGYGGYQYGKNIIEFGPGHAEHRWTQLRGALPKLDAISVYITGFTPFNITLQIS